MFFYLLYLIGYILSNILPLRFAYWLAERFSDIQYFIAKNDREAVAKNLSIVLNEDIEKCLLIARKVFRNFGLYLVDFFRMPRLSKEEVSRRVTVEGKENLDSALKKNKGVIVLSGHLGNWEMGGVATAILGYDISAVALNHAHQSINQLFIRQREKKGLRVIPINSVMKRCISALMRNGVLALLGDRDFTNSGITLDLFGVATSIPRGPALLSLKMKTPIVPSFFIRVDRYNYKLIFDKPIDPFIYSDKSEDIAIQNLTKDLINIMETYIRRYAEQWLVFRKFWEAPVNAIIV